MHWRSVVVAVAAALANCAVCGRHGPRMAGQWAVGLRGEDSSQQLEQRARSIAKEHGLVFKGPVSLPIGTLTASPHMHRSYNICLLQVAGLHGVFQLAAPKSTESNSSELTRSLQLNEEVVSTSIIYITDLCRHTQIACMTYINSYCLLHVHYLQVVMAEQQQLLLRELRSSPSPARVEIKPLKVKPSVKRGKSGRVSRSGTSYFTLPTDPLWSKQWSLVRSYYTISQ